MESTFRGGRVIAHRGSRLLWPENTAVAFGAAAGLGVRLFETDLHVSADGIVVCIHDPTLDRTTGGHGLTAETPYAEMRGVDAGYRHRADGGFPFRERGIEVPTFSDLVERFPDAGFVVDLKADGTEEPLARLVADHSLHERVIVGSFSDRRLRRFRELTDNRVPTSTGFDETLRALVRARAPFRSNPFGPATVAMQVPVSWYGVPVVTPRLIELVHRFELMLHVWTVNEPQEMKRLWDLGVDAVITDRPDLALQSVGK